VFDEGLVADSFSERMQAALNIKAVESAMANSLRLRLVVEGVMCVLKQRTGS
jgi:hypothetical protein